MAANIRNIVFIALAFSSFAASELQCDNLSRTVTCSTKGDGSNKLDRGIVSDKSNTLNIILRDCKINDILEEAFAGLAVLQTIDLSANNIERLRPGVFEGVKKVTHLNLSHNFIEQFPEGFFEDKPNLEVLDLKSNSITALRVGIFDPFDKLQYLDLSDNSLLGSRIDSHLFDLANNIRTIDLSGNDMTNTSSVLLSKFKLLNNLKLNRCKLKSFPNFAIVSNLGTMKSLSLAENQISSLDDVDTFKYLVNLEVLSLLDNAIEDIKANVFSPLRNLKKLMLGGNHLKLLPESTFTNLKSLNTVDLSDNSIEEISAEYFKGTSLENLSLSGNKLTFLQENFCSDMKTFGRNLKKLSFDNNPWQCTCLLDILTEVKKNSIVYNSFEFNGKAPVCVATREFSCKRLAFELFPPFE